MSLLSIKPFLRSKVSKSPRWQGAVKEMRVLTPPPAGFEEPSKNREPRTEITAAIPRVLERRWPLWIC